MALVGDETFWAGEQELLVGVVYPQLEEAVQTGVAAGANYLTQAGIAVDSAVANEVAAAFAKQYSFELVTGITETTATVLGQRFNDWIVAGNPVADFAKSLRTDPTLMGLFGPSRARQIAITESTRAFASGNMQMWLQSGWVGGKQWRTVNDKDVDPLCAGNQNQGVVPLRDKFQSGVDMPPAHVGCRCYMSPVLGGGQGYRDLWSQRDPSMPSILEMAPDDPRNIFWQWGQNNFPRSLYSDLTREQMSNLREYTMGKTRQMLNYMRTGKGRNKQYWQECVNTITNLISRASLPENMVLYRGGGSGALGGKLEIGAIFRDKGFVSTTVARETATDQFMLRFAEDLAARGETPILMKIQAPQGTPGIWVPSTGSSPWYTEYEWLLGPSEFRVTAIEEAVVAAGDLAGTKYLEVTVELVQAVPKGIAGPGEFKGDWPIDLPNNIGRFIWFAGDIE